MRKRLQLPAFALVIVAAVPYTVLKLLWLGGSEIGLRNPEAEMQAESTRMVVGNAVTILMQVIAVALAYLLISPWGRRIPALVVLTVGGAATGLLAPILLGLPPGLLLQLTAEGRVHTSGMDYLSPWVFALVYGGFALMAIALCVLLYVYATERWARVLSEASRNLSRAALIAGVVGLLPFGAAMLMWGLGGSGS